MAKGASKLEHYLKQIQDVQEERAFLRLDESIPVLYGFPNKKKIDYRQSSTVNISSGGIAIKVMDAPATVRKRLYNKNEEIHIKVEIPDGDEMVDFLGRIQWATSLDEAQEKDLIGIRFQESRGGARTALMAYALRVKRKKQLVKFSAIGLVFLLLATGIWAVNAQISQEKAENNLEISEKEKQRLKDDIVQLDQRKIELQGELNKNIEVINSQTLLLKQKEDIVQQIEEKIGQKDELLKAKEEAVMQKEVIIKGKENIIAQKEQIITDREKSIKEQEKAIKKTNEEIEKQKKALVEAQRKVKKITSVKAQIENRTFSYMVSAKSEKLYITNKADTYILGTESYGKAREAMKDENYEEAVYFFNQAIKKHPKSAVGYSGLTRALYKGGRKKDSKRTFQKYLSLISESIQ